MIDLPLRLKTAIYPPRGNLVRIRYTERGRPLEAFVHDDEVFGLVRECVLQRVYGAALHESGTVIDAGAHVGLFALAASCYAERVIALEPEPINFGVLEVNRRLNACPAIVPINAALWSEDTQLRFATSWHTSGGSVSPDGDVVVEARGLDSLIDEFGPIDVLKLDIEGAEAVVVPASKKLSQVRMIVGELHLTHKDEARTVLDPLRSQGFDIDVIPAEHLYTPAQLRAVFRNWSSLEHQMKIKLGLVALLLAPARKPRRPAGSRDMPLFVAARR